MDDNEVRIRQLQLIPVFALRRVVGRLIDDPATEERLRQRFRTVLNRRPRSLKRAVQRLNREQLTALIAACPEVADGEIAELFEEYRYGSNPSFYIYLFDPGQLAYGTLDQFRARFEGALQAFNLPREEGLARVRRLALNDLGALPARPEIVEGTYRFQRRLDFIDEDQNAVSVYETLYGFFWLNTEKGYAIVHARSGDVLQALRRAIEEGAQVGLAALVISKRLKNRLPFLMRDALRSGRLHDPEPGPDRFRWLTVTDDDPYTKGYQRLEDQYPEVRSARYREYVGDDKETSLTIRCDRGALSLAGKIRASQFRAWSVERLDQLIGVLDQLRVNPAAFVRTHQLALVPEMAKLNAGQKAAVLEILSVLLTLKQSGGLDYQPLGISPLDLAAEMGPFLRVQVPFACPEPGCGEEGYLACEICSATGLTARRQDGTWQLTCRGRGHKLWATDLPLSGACVQGHPFVLEGDELAQRIELLPGPDLVHILAGVVNGYLPGYTFDPAREGFIVRGPNLVYYPDRGLIRDGEQDGAKTVFNVTQNIGTVSGGEIGGVNIDRTAGRDRRA